MEKAPAGVVGAYNFVMFDNWPPSTVLEGNLEGNLSDFPIGEAMQVALDETNHILKYSDLSSLPVHIGYFYAEGDVKRACVRKYKDRYYITVSIRKAFYLFRYINACLDRSDLMSSAPIIGVKPIVSANEIEQENLFDKIEQAEDKKDIFRMSMLFVLLHESAHCLLGHLRDDDAKNMIDDFYDGDMKDLTEKEIMELMADRYAAHYYAQYVLNIMYGMSQMRRITIMYKSAVAIQLLFESYSTTDKWIEEYSEKTYPAPQIRSVFSLAGFAEILDQNVDNKELLTALGSGLEAGIKIASRLWGKSPQERDGTDYASFYSQVQPFIDKVLSEHKSLFNI